ncbi:MAG: hypothetical protein Q9O74_04760 [Planctomycetota bacterium]|nr:hypothetical protein [Planctomycetota bacterium]
MAKKTRRFAHKHLDIGGAALAFAIAGAAFWFGVNPVLHSGDDVRRLMGQVSLSQSQLEVARLEHRGLQQEIRDARASLDALSIELDTSDQLASRQAGIGRVLEGAGVSVSQFVVGSVQPGELLDIIPLRINGTGTSPDVIAAMHALRERFPDVAISSFQMAVAGDSTGQQVVFGFDLAWYIASDGVPES